jgi:hypothetical protein
MEREIVSPPSPTLNPRSNKQCLLLERGELKTIFLLFLFASLSHAGGDIESYIISLYTEKVCA